MKFFLFLFFSLLLFYAQAQQLDQIGKKGALKVSGGVGLSNNLYLADGISNRLAPYSYLLSGNVNFTLYGFSLPFSFAFSNQNFSYRQPFNIYGLSPTYKKWTMHLGYRNMSFSPYTLNGHNFLGGGIEYRGDALTVTAMSGRLLRAVEYDSTNINSLPTYQRVGGGVKVAYRIGSDEVFVAGFLAKDNVKSIADAPGITGLAPQENLVWSIGGKKVLYGKLTLQAEGARSAWTSDMRAEGTTRRGDLLSNLYFIPWRQTTLVYDALKASADYKFSFMSVGAGYERVEPEFRTLGAYFFNNDLENITLNFSTSLFKNKIAISANGGLQRDDLQNTKASSMDRKVGSVNLTFTPMQRLNFNFLYSNFYSFINIKPVDERYLQNPTFSQFDTLNFTQISQTVNGSANFKILESDAISQNIGVSTSFMNASNRQGGGERGNTLLNGSVFYNQQWKKSGLSLGVNTNASQTQFDAGASLFAGVGVSSGIAVLKKKLRISLGTNINQSFEGSTLVARLYAVNNSYSIRILKKHSLNAGLRYSGRAKLKEASLSRYNTTFNEFFGSVGYSYSF